MSETYREKGSAQIIEMTVVLPLICAVLILLVCAGIYVYQVATLECIADIAAGLAAAEEKIPGYLDYYGESIIKSASLFNRNSVYIPDISKINTVAAVHDPYRYYFQNNDKSRSEELLSAYISECSVLPGDYDCKILYGEGIGKRQIKVKIIGQVLPVSLGMMKINGINVDVCATATSVCSTELIGNTELVFDLCGYFWNDLKLGSDNTTLKERVGTFSEYFKSVFKGG